MKVTEVKLSDIHPYENNPRMNENAVSYVAESIKAYGFKVPIVIDKDNVIVAGHTRYKAAVALGMETVPCVIADDLTPKQIKAYRIADNKVSDFSIWDNKRLLEELDGLDDMFTGFELGGVFDNTSELDENDKTPVHENEKGVTYEVVFRSGDREKVERIKAIWEEDDVQSISG